MRIYNPQNQFGKDLVTKELVSTNLAAITGYALSDSAVTPEKGTLQAQIDALKTGKLSYVILTKEQWDVKKVHLGDEDVNTVFLVPEGTAEEGSHNIYTEYLVYKITGSTPTIKYEKIGEIGGDVSELVSRIKALEDNSIGDVKVTDSTNAITVEVADAAKEQNPKKTATITVRAASTTQYGVAKLSAKNDAETAGTGTSVEFVVAEQQLTLVKVGLDGKIDDLTNATTVAVGQVRVADVSITESEHVSGVFTISPVSGAATVKILTVEDNTGEEWSHKSVADDDTGVKFQVWNDESATKTDWDDMDASSRPSGFKVTYVVLTLPQA